MQKDKIKIAFATQGCKLNFAETSGLKADLPEDICEVVPFSAQADIYVINTCTVTDAADKKGRNLISRANRMSPDSKVIVVGCQSQVNAEKMSELEGVALVLGNQEKFELSSFIKNLYDEKIDKVIHVTERKQMDRFFSAVSQSDRTRCFLKIQDGCDYFCSYCIVPHARGKSRSASVEEVVSQIKNERKKGINEVILTGVNTGDFGKTTGETLCHLIEQIFEHTDLPRLRLSSVEPDLLTDDIIALFGKYPRLMPYIHLPLQSGSDEVLQKMKRRYTTSFFEGRVTRLLKEVPHAFVGVDVICGFPGETKVNAEETRAFLASLSFSALHVFPYSSRPGTPAAESDLQVSSAEKDRRTKELFMLSEEKKKAFYLRFADSVQEVLVEKISLSGKGEGFTENYIPVTFEASPEVKRNTIVKVKLTQEMLNEKVKGNLYHG